jgi:hypothetical protein
MCFKLTRTQREYYRYQGVSADLERRGYGSSQPEVAWANRHKEQDFGKPVGPEKQTRKMDEWEEISAVLSDLKQRDMETSSGQK